MIADGDAMDVRTIAEEPLVFSPEDSVSRAASVMVSENKSAALVARGDVLQGVVHAATLARKRINNPEKTKIGGFAIKTEVLIPGTTVKEAVNKFLINDYDCLPVEDFERGEMLILTKNSLLKGVRVSGALSGRKAGDAMNVPYSIGPDDSVSTARAMLRDINISNLVVVSGRRAFGVLGAIDLLVPLARGDATKKGSALLDKGGFESVSVASLMKKDFPRASPAAPLADVVEDMAKQSLPVVVENRKGMLGVITPTDILKLVGTEKKGVYVNITGMQEEDDFLKSVVDEEISNSMSRLAKMLPLQYLAAHVESHFPQGRRRKYSVKCRLITEKGVFISGGHAWDLTKAFRQSLERMERKVKKHKETKLI